MVVPWVLVVVLEVLLGVDLVDALVVLVVILGITGIVVVTSGVVSVTSYVAVSELSPLLLVGLGLA